MLRGAADGDRADHLAVRQRVQLPRVPRDARAHQRVRREGHRLHLAVRRHVEGVGPGQGGGHDAWGGAPENVGYLRTLTPQSSEVPAPCLLTPCV